jgi:hypothetical protein
MGARERGVMIVWLCSIAVCLSCSLAIEVRFRLEFVLQRNFMSFLISHIITLLAYKIQHANIFATTGTVHYLCSAVISCHEIMPCNNQADRQTF